MLCKHGSMDKGSMITALGASIPSLDELGGGGTFIRTRLQADASDHSSERMESAKGGQQGLEAPAGAAVSKSRSTDKS